MSTTATSNTPATIAAVAAIVAALIAAFGVYHSGDVTTENNLLTAQRTAWAAYLGTLDDFDRIQPDLSVGKDGALDPTVAKRFLDAYPESKRQAAAVRILVDKGTAEKIELVQAQLSHLAVDVQKGQRSGAPDITNEVADLFDTARGQVGDN